MIGWSCVRSFIKEMLFAKLSEEFNRDGNEKEPSRSTLQRCVANRPSDLEWFLFARAKLGSC